MGQTFQAITDRFAGFQAQWLNAHVDFPLLQRIAHPSPSARSAIPASKSTIRGSSAYVLLHGGTHVGGGLPGPEQSTSTFSLHLLTQAERAHVGPYLAYVRKTLRLSSALSYILPTKWVSAVGLPN
jgi:hypothetical protein